MSVGSNPTRASEINEQTTRLVILPAACKTAVRKRGGGRRKVQFLHKPSGKLRVKSSELRAGQSQLRLVLLTVQDAGPSSRRRRVQIPHEVLALSGMALATGVVASISIGTTGG